MKKVMKKSISVLMIVVMCLTMAPLQGFVGMDVTGWFASEAEAAVIEDASGYKIGILQSYETIKVINTGAEKVRSITVDGHSYDISSNYTISDSYAKSCMKFKVIFRLKDGKVTYFKSREDALNEVKRDPTIAVASATVEHSNGSWKDRKVELQTYISHGINSYGETVLEEFFAENDLMNLENISVTYTLSDNDILRFKDKRVQIKKEIDDILSVTDEVLEFSEDIYVNKDYEIPEDVDTVTVEISCDLSAELNYGVIGGNKKVYAETTATVVLMKKNPENIPTVHILELFEQMEEMASPAYCDDEAFKGVDGKARLNNIQAALGALKVLKANELSEINLDVLELVVDVNKWFYTQKYPGLGDFTQMFMESLNEKTEGTQAALDAEYIKAAKEIINRTEDFHLYVRWFCQEKGYQYNHVNKTITKCPVDIDIKDETGEPVVSIVNDVVQFYAQGAYAYVAENGAKVVYLPTDIEHSITITATDNGTMDYSFSEYTPGGVERIIKYEDVPLTVNEYYTAAIPNEVMTKADAFNLLSSTGETVEYDVDTLPPVEDNIVDVVVSEELFDGFPKEIVELVANTMFNMKSVVDLSAYDISTDDAVALFSAVAKYYPVEYSLIATSDFRYRIIVSPNLDRIMKIRFYYGDSANLDDYKRRAIELNAAIDALVAKVEGMNEFEKALYIHDYIVLNSEYDLELLEYMEANNCILPGELRSEKYTEYSILVNGTGVCGSYALAYRAVLNAAGMECLYLSSKQMNHAWNLVKIDGKWYHVDCCWDDPVPDTYGRARRTYFLRTDKEIMDLNHYSWTPGKYKANSDTYSDMPRDYDIKQKYDDGKWYYLKDDELYSSDVYGDNEVKIGALSTSTIDVDDGHIYFVSGACIYEYNPGTTQKILVYMTPKEKQGYSPAKLRIYNVYVDGENVEIYKTIYNKDNETVEIIDKATLQKSKLATITGIDISDAVEIDVFNSSALTASVVATESLEGFDFTLKWSSSNENIVSVDQNGNIFAKNVGNATITVSLAEDVDGLVSASCEVRVLGDGLSGVCGENATWNVDISSKTLTINGTGALTTYGAIEDWPWHTFRNGIENIVIEDGITMITQYAFMDMVNIKEIEFPDSVENLRNSSLKNCASLEFVKIGSGLKSLGIKIEILGRPIHYGYETVFEGCINLRGFIISQDNSAFAIDDYGALIEKDGSIVYKYPAQSEDTQYIFSDAVQNIAGFAFENAEMLEEIVINDGVTSISKQTFKDCTNLTSIDLPETLTSLAYGSFYNCKSLTSIDLPETLTNITCGSFYNCKSLTSIHLPKSLATITEVGTTNIFEALEYGLFSGCDNLEYISVDSENTKFYSDKFGALYEKNEEESEHKLWRLPPKYSFKEYIVRDGVTHVEDHAFENCNSLEKILFEESVTKIEGGHSLQNLKKIYILAKGECKISSIVSTEDGKVYCYESMLMASEVPVGRYWLINESHEHDYFLRDFVGFTDTTDGYEYYKCFGCDLDYSTITHNNGEPVTTEATCTLDGNKSVKCKVCGEVAVLETIPATGKHDYQLTSTTPGSCMEAPVYHYSCLVCGGTKDKTGTIEEGHKYIENVIEPTCTEKGYTIATCSECDETVIYDYKSPKGHSLDIKRKDSYCSAHDSIEYSCKICDYKEVIVPDAELLETTTVTVEPTCTKSGSHTDVCNLCGATVAVEILNPLSHEYSTEYTVDKEPTCTAEGQKSQHCTRCDAKRAVTAIESTGHKNTGIINAADATCTTNGYTGDTFCYDCNTTVATGSSTEMLKHSYSSVVTAPTCTAKGYTTYTCTACGDTYTSDETAMLKHSYTSVVTPVSCTANGYTTYICAVCSHSYNDNIIPSVGHSYNDNGTCTGCGKSRAENCTHMCHKSGFTGFIWKIVRFFLKLFKIQPVCSCGVKHW